jgi:hypothetical protein
MSESTDTSAAEAAPLLEAGVRAAHAAVLEAIHGVEQALKSLIELVPIAEQDGKKFRMVTPDMNDSLNECRRNMKQTVLNVLVVAQGAMNYTEEAKEAAIKAQAGRFKVVGEPGAPSDAT